MLITYINGQPPASVISTDTMANRKDIILAESVILKQNDRYSVWFQVTPLISGNAVEIGQLRIYWRRDSFEAEHVTETLVPLPALKIQRTPFSTVVDTPAHGLLGHALPFTVVITNHTHFLQDFQVTVKDTDAFLFAGTRQSLFKILPNSSYKIKYNLVPLTSGRVALPHFQIISKRFDKELPGTKQKRFVFIRLHNQ